MTTVFILPTGNDVSGDGSSGNPWATISKAVTATVANDTIVCLAGTYTWVSQTFSTARNIVGAGFSTTVFDGGAGNISWKSNAAIRISGITFKNSVATPGAHVFNIDAAAASFTFADCSFTVTAISAWTVFGVGNNLPAGVACALTLTSCQVVNCAQSGGGNFGIFSDEEGVALVLTLTNNTFYTNLTSGNTLPIFNTDCSGWTATYTNNIFYNANGVNEAWVGGSGVAPATQTGSNNDILGYSGAPSLSAQLSTDPLFVDEPNLSFGLRSNSPCLAAGTVVGALTGVVGLNGLPFISDTVGRVDMGAFPVLPNLTVLTNVPAKAFTRKHYFNEMESIRAEAIANQQLLEGLDEKGRADRDYDAAKTEYDEYDRNPGVRNYARRADAKEKLEKARKARDHHYFMEVVRKAWADHGAKKK